jgi:hypothetical protein
MNLQEVFDQLVYGELSQLSIGGGEVGSISEANYPRVLAHINLGLTALYKRFPLKEGRVSVELVPGKLLYATAAVAPDLLKIEQVRTDGGFEFPLNDESDPYSVFTPTASSLRVPADVVAQLIDLPDWFKTINLELVYRANHPKVIQGLGFFDPKRVLLQLPETHLEPLLLFVASRAMTPMGVGQFEGQAGNNYYAKYEAACQSLESINLRVDQGSQNSRLHSNGWV